MPLSFFFFLIFNFFFFFFFEILSYIEWFRDKVETEKLLFAEDGDLQRPVICEGTENRGWRMLSPKGNISHHPTPDMAQDHCRRETKRV